MKKIVGIAIICMLIFRPALAEIQAYTCPMHPHYISEQAGTCPVCGMDLVPVKQHNNARDEHAEHHHAHHNMEEAHSVIAIPPQTIRNMGIRTEKATITNMGGQIRSYGVIVPNERLQKKVYSRVEGWISALGVSAVGDNIKQGEHLYTIHSPDLVLAQHDLLSLERRGRNIDLSKLFVHYEVDKEFIRTLRSSGKVKENVPYYSSYSGTVTKLYVRPGSHVTRTTPLMETEDYSSVWVEVHVAQKDLPFLTKGDTATITFSGTDYAKETTTIDYIYPEINPDSRTGRVRLVLENPDQSLKPGAYTDVTFETRIRQRLNIPSEAILRRSDGEFVVIAPGNGRFQPRQVHTGLYRQGRTEILHGIKAGESVVVSGQFLLDSESSLRDAFRRMEKMGSSTAGGGHAHH